MTLGGLNCAHCAEVIGQKVSDLDEVEIANLNFVNKKLSFELKDGASRKLNYRQSNKHNRYNRTRT